MILNSSALEPAKVAFPTQDTSKSYSCSEIGGFFSALTERSFPVSLCLSLTMDPSLILGSNLFVNFGLAGSMTHSLLKSK
ncbi:hypothetical protein WICPIJ_006894 [Wickerhamomyces pijperi]|uniref:Uncharacterized protein n=1 Tax=Wickerhamomyces pijperi TaxID=599730 RepID=A0A9P8Q176_WICPI|nr:hypothetical protein WICPIJ_006894 [Wickerhamomyces pijperi]